MQGNLRVLLALTFLALACFFPSPAFSYTFTAIDFPGAAATYALGINSSGQVVGFYYKPSANHGFLFDHGAFTSIDYPGATDTFALAINDASTIVGYYSQNTTMDWFAYDHGVFTKFYPISTSDNPSQGITGYYYLDGKYCEFEYLGTRFTPIDYPGATDAIVLGASETGEVSGIYYVDEVAHGFLALPAPGPDSLLLLISGLACLASLRKKP
jgi:hypothetical protein